MVQIDRSARHAELLEAGATERIANRVCDLEAAHAKLSAKAHADPDHTAAAGWRQRLGEYETSLANLRDFGVETVASGKPLGAVIEPPAGAIVGNGNAPEGA